MEKEKQKITIVSKKDLDISYYIGPGKGGQKKQKTSSGCQIIHRESGAISKCSENRSQAQNKKLAFERLVKVPKFRVWLNKKLFEIREGERMEEQIDKELENPNNIKYEVKIDGKWTEIDNKYFDTEEAKKEN